MSEKITIRIGPEDCSQVRLTRDHELVITTDGNPAYEIAMDESLLDRLIVAASQNPWLTEGRGIMPLTGLSAAEERRIDAGIAITYTYGAEDRERWFREHPVSMFEESAPVMYNDRARKAAPKYGTCPLCDLVKDLVLDHCHRHWWARGSICHSCNTKMCHVDGGGQMAERYALKYFEWRRNCVDCSAAA